MSTKGGFVQEILGKWFDKDLSLRSFAYAAILVMLAKFRSILTFVISSVVVEKSSM